MNKPLIISVRGKKPVIGKKCFLSPNCTLIGDIIMGDECSVWFNAVVRGDVNYIKMGNKVNIQDGAVIHGTFNKCGTTIGNNVSIGHNALVHGCELKENVLVGMGAIVMDKSVVHSNVIVGAGAVVKENAILEANSIYAGVPAKKIKDISPEQVSGEIQRIANNYTTYASWFGQEHD